MTPKIVGLTRACGTCPNYGYHSGGASRCGIVDEYVSNKDVIAPFCPLADYPSRALSDLSTSLDRAQYPLQERSLARLLLDFIAAKLRTVVMHQEAVVMAVEESRRVVLQITAVTAVRLQNEEIEFLYGEDTYRLQFAGRSCALLRQVPAAGYNEEPMWVQEALKIRSF